MSAQVRRIEDAGARFFSFERLRNPSFFQYGLSLSGPSPALFARGEREKKKEMEKGDNSSRDTRMEIHLAIWRGNTMGTIQHRVHPSPPDWNDSHDRSSDR